MFVAGWGEVDAITAVTFFFNNFVAIYKPIC